MVITINGSSLVRDATIWLRDILISGISDPISGNRQTDARFVMTSFPQRPVDYPLITVKCNLGGDNPIGIGTESRLTPVNWEIRVWSKSVTQKDKLADSIYSYLRNYQLDASESVSQGLFNFRITQMFDVDEPGKDGMKSKIIEGKYLFICA